MSSGETAYYLYCLTPGGGDVKTSGVGVDGQRPVCVRACGGIGAVLSEVALEGFSGEQAEAHLQDLAWLGPRACRHAAVIEEVMRQAPVLPARFATLFTSLESLERSVVESREAIQAFFTELGDRQEWGVKGLLDRAASLRGLGAAEAPAPDTAPGAKYFQEKRVKAQLARDFSLRLREFCRRAATALGAQASVFRERKVLGSDIDGEDGEVVLNWAFLVAPAALEDFRVRLGLLNGDEAFPGLLLRLTGPWPPYSFAPDLSAQVKP